MQSAVGRNNAARGPPVPVGSDERPRPPVSIDSQEFTAQQQPVTAAHDPHHHPTAFGPAGAAHAAMMATTSSIVPVGAGDHYPALAPPMLPPNWPGPQPHVPPVPAAFERLRNGGEGVAPSLVPPGTIDPWDLMREQHATDPGPPLQQQMRMAAIRTQQQPMFVPVPMPVPVPMVVRPSAASNPSDSVSSNQPPV